MSHRLVIDAATEPVTLEEVKTFIRHQTGIGNIEDGLLNMMIKAARKKAENLTARAFIEQTWEKKLDYFPDAINLPMPYIMGVNSIKYIDLDGNEQTLSNTGYVTDDMGLVGYVVPAFGYTWPQTRRQINAVTIRWRAGFGADASSVPEPIKNWLLMCVSSMYAVRESIMPDDWQPTPFMDGLLDEYRVVSLG